MRWKQKINAAVRHTGYELRRLPDQQPDQRSVHGPDSGKDPAAEPQERNAPEAEPDPHDLARPPARPDLDRLLTAPVFVLSSVRSGSTLLRVILNSHSQIHSPHELHHRRLRVEFTTWPVRKAIEECDLRRTDLEHLLWDRLLHRELVKSGKSILVEKTPSNVFAWRRIRQCWPDARFIFLLRHPLSVARSWHEADPVRRPMERAVEHTLNYMKAVEAARDRLEGFTLRYEELTADPQTQTRRLCDFLGVAWEPRMLAYGDHDHGTLRKGIGDWRDKIATGRVQAGRPLPGPKEVPEALRDICVAWDYHRDAPAAAGTDAQAG